MVLTVLENAYLRRIQEHPNFSELHKKIIFLLTHEKKYYTKDELFYLASFSEKRVEKALRELEEKEVIKINGWLVKLIDYEGIF